MVRGRVEIGVGGWGSESGTRGVSDDPCVFRCTTLPLSDPELNTSLGPFNGLNRLGVKGVDVLPFCDRCNNHPYLSPLCSSLCPYIIYRLVIIKVREGTNGSKRETVIGRVFEEQIKIPKVIGVFRQH